MNPSPVSSALESVLLKVIIQLIVIIASARIFGNIFRRFGQPMVCGEIAAGLLLGPSVVGRFFPGTFHTVFDPAVGPVFSIMSQLGLIFLMFLIGLEFDFGHLKENRAAAFAISGTGIVFPFSLGLILGYYLHSAMGIEGSPLSFSLFMATAMSITALPILGRIMIELNLNRTRLGSITISAAAMDDASGWIILALITALVRSTFDPGRLAIMVISVLAYAAVMMLLVRPALIKWSKSVLEKNNGTLSLGAMATIIILLLISAAITNIIGIFSIFGGFLFGAIFYDQEELREAINSRLRDFITTFFLPIFFTYTGLRTDIGSMTSLTLWGYGGLVLGAAVLGKMGGCTLAARLSGMKRNEALMVGTMMNTRALMELIVINIGYDLGIVPKSVFFMLVFMAVFTTYMTVPILRRLVRHTEVWEEYRASDFAARLDKTVAAGA
jgi:Kef-type K+ transport system membrane component KefB